MEGPYEAFCGGRDPAGQMDRWTGRLERQLELARSGERRAEEAVDANTADWLPHRFAFQTMRFEAPKSGPSFKTSAKPLAPNHLF